jgi:transcriptional regulator with XRE-family HTH domain
MDSKEFGRRVQVVREELLGLTQMEIASEMEISQGVYSRVENGHGAHINFVFALLNLLEKRNLHSHRLFRNPFDLELLKETRPYYPGDKRAQKILYNIQEQTKENLENLNLMMEIMKDYGMEEIDKEID